MLALVLRRSDERTGDALYEVVKIRGNGVTVAWLHFGTEVMHLMNDKTSIVHPGHPLRDLSVPEDISRVVHCHGPVLAGLCGDSSALFTAQVCAYYGYSYNLVRLVWKNRADPLLWKYVPPFSYNEACHARARTVFALGVVDALVGAGMPRDVAGIIDAHLVALALRDIDTLRSDDSLRLVGLQCCTYFDKTQ